MVAMLLMMMHTFETSSAVEASVLLMLLLLFCNNRSQLRHVLGFRCGVHLLMPGVKRCDTDTHALEALVAYLVS